MTEHTTPITVHLTDEQMDDYVNWKWGPAKVLAEAIEAQRPRPIAVGDRVTAPAADSVWTVEAIKDGMAWLWRNDGAVMTRLISELTRVDGEAAT